MAYVDSVLGGDGLDHLNRPIVLHRLLFGPLGYIVSSISDKRCYRSLTSNALWDSTNSLGVSRSTCASAEVGELWGLCSGAMDSNKELVAC